MASGEPCSQLDTGLLLPGVGEPAHVAQCGGQAVAVAHQGGEHPARFDRADLTVIADEDHLGPGGSCRPHQLVEGERAGQAGLVDDHQLVRRGAASGPVRASARATAGPGGRSLPGGEVRGRQFGRGSSPICAAARLLGGARRATWPCSPCRCRARRPAPRPRRRRGPGRAPSPLRARLPTPPGARPSWWTCPSRPGRPARRGARPEVAICSTASAWSRD